MQKKKSTKKENKKKKETIYLIWLHMWPTDDDNTDLRISPRLAFQELLPYIGNQWSNLIGRFVKVTTNI